MTLAGVRITLRRRLLACAALVSAAMLFVGVLLAAVGILLLEMSGGAARDTSLVILVVAYAITDFWGASVVAVLTRGRIQDVTAAWTIVRTVTLVGFAVIAPQMYAIAAVMIVLAPAAAWAGARIGRAQAIMREAERALQIPDVRELADAAAEAGRSPVGTAYRSASAPVDVAAERTARRLQRELATTR